jgi:hypothetical protein
VVTTTHTAKETIGYTLAPSVLSQFSWKHLAPPPDDHHHKPTFKLNHKSPWELYTTLFMACKQLSKDGQTDTDIWCTVGLIVWQIVKLLGASMAQLEQRFNVASVSSVVQGVPVNAEIN